MKKKTTEKTKWIQPAATRDGGVWLQVALKKIPVEHSIVKGDWRYGFSMTGVIGPLRNGDCRGSCGQCGIPADARPVVGWTAEDLEDLRAIWERWHLNDMRAGSEVQEQHLRSLKFQGIECPPYPASYLDWARSELAKAGLEPDADGYSYGCEWKREPLPVEVVQWWESLVDVGAPRGWKS
jgi:hypothetical protein